MNAGLEYELSKKETEELVKKYCEDRGYTFKEGPTHADFDYYIYENGELVHYLEVKIRRTGFMKYKYIKLPLRKHTFAQHIWNKTDITSYFLCYFEGDDITAILDLAKEPSKEEVMVARWDRGESSDLYALYHQSEFGFI